MRNLKIEEMFVGAYVQVMQSGFHLSSPQRISGIIDKSGVFLGSAPDTPSQVDSDFTHVYAISIDDYVMRGFGFSEARGEDVYLLKRGDIRLTVSLRMRHGRMVCRRCAITGKISCWNEDIRDIHELQRWWNDKVYLPYNIPLDLVWNEIQDENEEL